MVMARNAVHNRSFGLDASVLMDDALRLDKRLIHEWSFDLDKGDIAILCKAKKFAGTIRLFLNWPKKDLPTGFVTVSDPNWETLPRYVLLTGISNKDGGFPLFATPDSPPNPAVRSALRPRHRRAASLRAQGAAAAGSGLCTCPR